MADHNDLSLRAAATMQDMIKRGLELQIAIMRKAPRADIEQLHQAICDAGQAYADLTAETAHARVREILGP